MRRSLCAAALVLLIGCGGSSSGDAPADAASIPGTDVDAGATLGSPCTTAGELACQGVGGKLQLLCDGTKWTSNGVCAGDDVCDPRPGPTAGSCQKPACTAGSVTCEGAALTTCGADLLTKTKEECASAEHCKQAVGGVCAKCLAWEARCEGAVLMKCTADRQSIAMKETCATPELCDATAGACKPAACALDEHRCNGDILEKCNAARSAFEPVKVCAASLCDAAGKECDDCKSGAAECVGTTPRTCDSTGHWMSGATCGGSTPVCKAGICEPGACAAGDHRCAGDILEQCKSDLTGFDPVRVCMSGLCDATGKVCDECKSGAVDCVGETPRACDSTGHWRTLTACGGTTPLCKSGVCSAGACVAGEHRCNANVLERCNSTFTGFTGVMTCGSGLCDAAGKECDECVVGATDCVGNTPRRCDSTGHWTTLTACSGSTPLCTAGSCAPGACFSGEYRCSGDLLEKCNTGLTGFDPVTTCAAGLCDAVGKECDECITGSKSCAGNTPRSCDSTGHWTSLATCTGTTPICKSGDCTTFCSSGEHRCSGNVLERCNSTLSGFETVATCGSGLCDAVGKECDDCKLGEKSCSGTTPRVCDTTGHWSSLTACSGSTPYCSSGSCSATAGQTYTASFTSSVTTGLSSPQCTSWDSFRSTLTGPYTKITIFGSLDPVGVSCTGTSANTLCQALGTGSTVTSLSCDDRTWRIGQCGSSGSIELTAGPRTVCQCDTPGYAVRPCIGNANWGGAGTNTCDAPTQTISVRCE